MAFNTDISTLVYTGHHCLSLSTLCGLWCISIKKSSFVCPGGRTFHVVRAPFKHEREIISLDSCISNSRRSGLRYCLLALSQTPRLQPKGVDHFQLS